MALFNTLLSLTSLFPTAAQDVTAVYDKDYNQVFKVARPVKIATKELSTMMSHPVETGESIVDHRIILPLEIDLFLISERGKESEAYSEIRQAQLKAVQLNLQTRSTTFANMFISDILQKQDPDQFDVVLLNVKLREALFVSPQFGKLPDSKVKDKKDSDTVKKGTQTPKTPNDSAKKQSESILHKVLF